MSDASECYVKEIDASYKSTQPHPTQSSAGLVRWMNFYRARGNSKEPLINGEIDDTVLQNIADAAAKTKVPASLIAHVAFWNTDSTTPDDPNEIGHKLIGLINDLRTTLGRDPNYGEILASHALGGAAAVKQLLEKAQNEPEKIAEPSGGGKKQDVIFKKLRANKLVKRTNREAYEFFKHRMLNGNQHFTKFMGNNSTVVNALGAGNPIAAAITQASGQVQQLMAGVAAGHLQQLISLAAANNVGGIQALLQVANVPKIASVLGGISQLSGIVSALQSGSPQGIISAVSSLAGGGVLQGAISQLTSAAGPMAGIAQGIMGSMGANLSILGSGGFGGGDDGSSFTPQYGDASKELETGEPGKGPYGDSDIKEVTV